MFCSVVRRFLLASALFTLCFASPANAAANQALQKAAKAELSAYMATLKTLVLTESGSTDAVGLASVAEQLDRHLVALGFATRRHASAHGVKADTVVGTKTGSGKQRILLMAHMDTVYKRGILKSVPYRVEKDRIYGPGIADAKGGIAMILHALKLLNDAGWNDFATITVLFNPDEEVGSPGSHKLITDLAARSDTVLSFEPTWSGAPVDHYLLLGHAAYAQVRLEIKGVAGHASTPAKGKNAVMELAHQILATKKIADGIPGAQLTWTNVLADQAYNQIPALAVAIGDGRITVPGADAKLLAALKKQVESKKLIAGTKAKVTLEILRPMFQASKAADAVLRIADRIHEELKLKSFYPVRMIKGSTDAGYAALSGKAAVVESFGPTGDGYHGTGEHILIKSIEPRLYLVARLLTELGKQAK